MSMIYGGNNVTFPDGTTQNTAPSGMGFKNRIINGAMMIDQRYAGTGPNSITNGDCCVDRFGMYYSGNSYTSQQSTTAPEGFKNSLLLTVTGTTTPTYSFFGQRIEGLNVADLGFGQSWAKTITVSFWVRSSVTGIYSIAVTNGAGDRAYAVQYTINSANTWEYKTATIPGDTTGTWLTNNANGMYLRFNMGSPSGRTITAGSWQTANADGANGSTGSISWATTSGATFYITGVQLEKGSTATSFDYRPYGTELALCQRYFWMIATGNNKTISNGFNFTASNMTSNIQHPVTMRTTPTVFQATGTNYFGFERNGAADNFDSLSAGSATNAMVSSLFNNTEISGTAGHAGTLYLNNASAYLGLSAEL